MSETEWNYYDKGKENGRAEFKAEVLAILDKFLRFYKYQGNIPVGCWELVKVIMSQVRNVRNAVDKLPNKEGKD